MISKKALLIINPVSGTRSKRGLKKLVAERLGNLGIKVETQLTQKNGDAARMAGEAAIRGVDIVISAGGDGTVNEIANSLSHTNTVLGIIPLGSGNGLARSLGIPQDVVESLKIIEDQHVLVSDRGIVNDIPFYCTFGIGFDAVVSEKFSLMKRRGRITYIRSAVREFLKYQSQSYALSIEGKVITEKAFLIAVCNAPQYGNNAYIAPKAKLTDGFLDITMVHSGSAISTVFKGMELMTGWLDQDAGIDTFRIKKATIARLEEGVVHIDGDPRMMGKILEIKCDPGALRVFAPEKEPDFRPIVSPLRAMIDDMRFDMLARLRQFENGIPNNRKD